MFFCGAGREPPPPPVLPPPRVPTLLSPAPNSPLRQRKTDASRAAATPPTQHRAVGHLRGSARLRCRRRRRGLACGRDRHLSSDRPLPSTGGEEWGRGKGVGGTAGGGGKRRRRGLPPPPATRTTVRRSRSFISPAERRLSDLRGAGAKPLRSHFRLPLFTLCNCTPSMAPPDAVLRSYVRPRSRVAKGRMARRDRNAPASSGWPSSPFRLGPLSPCLLVSLSPPRLPATPPSPSCRRIG